MMRRRRYQSHAWRALSEPGNQLADLMSRQLSTFSWLCPLRHLDLNFFGRSQVGSRHAEASSSNLFDRAIRPIAVRPSVYSLRIFASFAGIGFSTNLIHGDRQTFMCFRA